MIMLRMDIIISTTLTGMSRPARSFIQSGVTNGEIKVVTDVIVTDSGTFPRPGKT
jgi:shikimate 5-dehydrogenase